MNRVFSAKLKTIDFDYEFANGSRATFTYRSPNTSELIAAAERGDIGTAEALNIVKTQFEERLTSRSESAVKELIAEGMESGNLFDLMRELELLLEESKAAKKPN
jgi:hypothetical protein